MFVMHRTKKIRFRRLLAVDVLSALIFRFWNVWSDQELSTFSAKFPLGDSCTRNSTLAEAACLTLIQFNEKRHVVSGICLCNYPNVPSVSPCDWLGWLTKHYGIANADERNTMFIHYLVWDDPYAELFLEDLLTAVFHTTTFCANVILTYPPWVSSSGSSENSQKVFERQMTRIAPRGMRDSNKIQVLYLSVRDLQAPRLNIRRLVEEDNDDVVPIIDAETSVLKDHYGEYYISEMARNPDGHRQIIVSQTEDGFVTGVMCLNDTVEIDLLNDNFELVPYNGLRKPRPDDEVEDEASKTASQIFYTLFSRDSDDRVQFGDSSGVETDGEDGFEEAEETYSRNDGEENESAEFANEDSPANAKQNAMADKMPKKESFQKGERRVRISKATSGAFTDPNDITPPAMRADSAGSIGTTTSGGTVKKEDLDRNTEAKTLVQRSSRYPKFSSVDEVLSIVDHLSYFETADLRSKMWMSAFDDATFNGPRRNVMTPDAKLTETLPFGPTQNAVKLPVYHGDLNVFVLEIFATRKETDERCGRDFLEAAFECFPDLDYCAMLVPFTQLHFPLLEQFARIPLRCNKDFPMTLYVAHKAVLLGKLKPRGADSYDRDSLRDFLNGIPNKDAILADFDDSVNPDRPSANSYVFECDSRIVGLAVICAEEHPDVIKRRYHVEEHVSMRNIPRNGYGRILHFVLMPIFSVYHRFFFRELLRLSELTVLFYRLYESDSSALTRSHPLATCLNSMIPVNPRKQIAYRFLNTDTVSDYEEYENLLRLDRNGVTRNEVFSLYMTSPRLAMIPMKMNDVKIVVVGASDCGVALVEYFALGSVRSHVRFTNLTLISPNGLPFENKRNRIGASMIPFRGRYCHDYGHLIGARAWINLVYGTVIAIDRKDKYVTVMNQGNLTYDYLILTCGLQYQKPIFPEETEAQKRGEAPDAPVPWNCMVINDDTEASICLRKIRSLTADFEREKAIVFYGNNIDCHCALRGLIEFGVKGSWITLIEPPLHRCERHDSVFFDDPEVDTAIMNGVRESGVTILSGWNMIDWNVDDTSYGQIIKSVLLDAKGERKNVRCDALVNFGEKTVDANIFLAIRRAGLVFDGQLVIDPECRSNDPFIFAAGTVTKYSRRFYAEAWQHKHNNSVEVGESLGKILRSAIDRLQRGEDRAAKQSKENPYWIMRRCSMPIIISCTLPGGYYYLHVRKPGKRIPPWDAVNDDRSGKLIVRCRSLGTGAAFNVLIAFQEQDFVTGCCASEIGYFRIRLNTYNSVETVTCVSRKAFEVQHMIALYGKHQRMLNEMKLRYAYSQIPDFYAYFREPWAAALFHDGFEQLRIENRKILLSKMGVCGDSLVDDCTRALRKVKWEEMLIEDRRRIESRYAGSVYRQQLEDRLLDFLQFSEDELPMYCNPRIVRQLYADVEDSPLYFDVWS